MELNQTQEDLTESSKRYTGLLEQHSQLKEEKASVEVKLSESQKSYSDC